MTALFFASDTELTASAVSHRDLHADCGALHPLCCDCDGCLNGSGGLVLPGAGVAVAEQSYVAVRRELELARQGQRRRRGSR